MSDDISIQDSSKETFKDLIVKKSINLFNNMCKSDTSIVVAPISILSLLSKHLSNSDNTTSLRGIVDDEVLHCRDSFVINSNEDLFREDSSCSTLLDSLKDESLIEMIEDFGDKSVVNNWLSVFKPELSWSVNCNLLEDAYKFNNSVDDVDFFTFETDLVEYSLPNDFSCFEVPLVSEKYRLLIIPDSSRGTPENILLSALNSKDGEKEFSRVVLPCFTDCSVLYGHNIAELSDNLDLHQLVGIDFNQFGVNTSRGRVTNGSNLSLELPKKIITVDEPFIFILQDKATDLPLILGQINAV